MAFFELKTEQDITDLLWGSTFYGVGGGGTAAEGFKRLFEQLEKHGVIRIGDLSEIPDDAWTAITSFMGNRAPLTPEQEAQKKKLGLHEWKYENNMAESVRYLEKMTGKKISGLIIPELGGANTPTPLATALELGIVPLDAAYASRALPEVSQCTPCMANLPLCPIASVDKWGNKTFITDVVNNDLGERIGKMLATAAFGNTAISYSLLPAKEMRKYAFSGLVRQCYDLGVIAREAKKETEAFVSAIASHCGGYEIFRGKLLEKKWEVKDGYLVGTNTFEGEGKFSGHTLKTWFKNENHVSWLDGKPFVCSPDLIAQIELSTFTPLLNNECVEGQHFSLIGIAACKEYRFPENLPFLDPKHYGFDIPYIPIEELVK